MTLSPSSDCLSMSERAPWPHSFACGDFVRLTHHPELWGRIVGPSEHAGRWIFEYPGGARVTNVAEAFEPFEPTPRQRQLTDARFAALASRRPTPSPEWPEGVCA
jgi:hypothetical protein